MSRLRPHPRFSLWIECVNHAFHVVSFNGNEAIDVPYTFDVEIVSEHPNLDLVELLHQPAFLAYGADGQGVHGQIYAIAIGRPHLNFTLYTLTLVPKLTYLEHRTNQRIFEQKTTEQIIAQLLTEHSIFSHAYAFKLEHAYHARDYCVQHHETDLHFVQRLCEEEGIHYHFQHSQQGHLLVFGDNQNAFSALEPPTPFLFDKNHPPVLNSGHFNAMWLLTEIHHQGQQPQPLEQHPIDGFVQEYRNYFAVTLLGETYHPARKHTKPCVLETHIARVIKNDPAHCTPPDRVKVQFDWHREKQKAHYSRCWLAACPSWKTAPHIGTQVRVAFIDGDPNQPIITGCLPEGRDPVEPQSSKSSVLRSRSTLSGTGYNEVQIEAPKDPSVSPAKSTEKSGDHGN